MVDVNPRLGAIVRTADTPNDWMHAFTVTEWILDGYVLEERGWRFLLGRRLTNENARIKSSLVCLLSGRGSEYDGVYQ